MMSTPANRTSVVLPVIAIVLLLVCLFAPETVGASQAGVTTAPGATTASGALFVENVGQFAPQARFMVMTGQGRFWIADDGVWLVTSQQPTLSADELQLPLIRRQRLLRARMGQTSAVRLSFAGGQLAGKLEPNGRLASQISFLHGADSHTWRTSVPAWSSVRVKDLYPGIDLVFDGAAGSPVPAGRLPWRLEARAGARVEAIRLQVAGVDDVNVVDGNLHLQTAAGPLSVGLPVLHGAKVVERPAVAGAASSGFEVAAPFGVAATTPEAVTDLKWATYLGGDGTDWAHNIALDATGNSYIVGDTSALDFPATTGVIDRTGDANEAFVAKLNPTGSALIYATYLGGSGMDFGWGVAVDISNVAYVVGDSDSNDFPGAGPGNAPAGFNDMYVVGLNATGTAATFVKFLGGTGPDYGYDVALDAGNVYAIGSTYSTDFPATVTAGAGGGLSDIIVAKITAAGAISYAAKVGGSACSGQGCQGHDEGYALQVRNGEVYGAGETDSFGTFPGGATIAGGNDAVVFKLTTAGSLSSSVALGDTLLGTPADDFANDLALDSAGAVYVTGGTASTAFPVTPGTVAFAGGQRDAFATKLTLAGTTWSVAFSVLIGGAGLDDGNGIAVDNNGGMIVTGETDSMNLPVTTNAYDRTANGANDAFLVRVHPNASPASRITYGTYLGGTGYEGGYAVAVDAGGNAFITGATDSADFPVTAGAFDTTISPGGAMDAFVARLVIPAIPAAPVLSIAVSGSDAALSWTQVTTDNFGAPMTVNGYRLWHSLNPYFSPGDASSPSPIYDGPNRTYTDAGVCASLDNYYYVVNAVGPNGELSVNSNRVGEFTFPLVKGQ